MGPYDNEKREYVYSDELMEGEWFEDEEGFLYILPTLEAVMDSEGPDNKIMDALSQCREKYRPNNYPDSAVALVKICRLYNLNEIHSHLRRWSVQDGFYHA